MMGAGGKAMLAVLGTPAGPGDAVEQEIQRRFGSLTFNRGKFEGHRMLAVAYAFPSYIQSCWAKSSDHMGGFPALLHEACCRSESTGWSVEGTLRALVREQMAPPYDGPTEYPTDRRPTTLVGEWVEPEGPEEPSFLDDVDQDGEVDYGGFLDGIL